MSPPIPQPGPEAKRRSQRLLLHMPVVVQKRTANQPPAEEETRTLVVNAHGALIMLGMKVTFGQELFLRNPKSQEEKPCKVVYLGPVENGKAQVGIEFTEPAPHFWHIAFPPEDWTPHSPEARRPEVRRAQPKR